MDIQTENRNLLLIFSWFSLFLLVFDFVTLFREWNF